MTRLRALTVALLAVAGLVASAPSAAAACTWLSCTQVYSAVSSQGNILVAAQWQSSTYNSSSKQTVRPGKTSTLRDVNAFWLPTGCTGTSTYGTFYGGRWYQPARDRYSIRVRC